MILVSSDNLASIEVTTTPAHSCRHPDFLATAIEYVGKSKIVVIAIAIEEKEI